jgi:hypothetical protein
MSEKWGRREWLGFVTIILIAIVGVTIAAMTRPEKDITGTLSKTEPTTQQDGTAAHPYADVSHCPSKVDIIFWPKNDQPIPIIPPGISVCFVGDRPLNDSAPKVELR